ncbi:MAG: hypothetical protein GY754_11280, partial [bacterium]|nr:hypothetical protein [bacterium]
VFEEMMRRLSKNSLTEDDTMYIEDEKEFIEEMWRYDQGRIKEGIKKGEGKIVIRMHQKGKSINEISDLTGLTPDEIETIIEQHEDF